MKRKIIFIPLVLMMLVGIVGCKLQPDPEDFVGEWRGKMLMTLKLYEDFTYTYGQSVWVFDRGTWIHNGDNTITLILNDDKSETIAEKHYDKDSERRYLLWDNDKFYEVE